MKVMFKYFDNLYTLSNEDLKEGDRVYLISTGHYIDGEYKHHKFDFRKFMSGFPDEPIIIKKYHHETYYKIVAIKFK